MTKDYSSIYSIEDFMVNKIAPQFFPNIDAVNTNNIGLFGMITHVTGNVIEDQFNITARYLNEAILSRATLPDFIYAYAASYDVTDIFGVPARAPMILAIKESDILTYAARIGDHMEFRLDADMKIYVDDSDMIFSIPYDILIESVDFGGDIRHKAIYDTSYKNSLVTNLISPYIKMFRSKEYGEVFLVLVVEAYQYERKRYIEPIITNNLLNIAFIDKTFQNKLANFEMFYEAPDSTELIQLKKVMDTANASVEPFVYYKMLDDGKIRFSFANDDRYFIPAYNSKVHIYIYETQGTLGNFNWKVDEIPVNTVPETENEEIAYNRTIFTDAQIRNASVGGRDQLTVEEIKALALERQITINSYTTERDLNLHFLNTMKIDGLTAIFVKHRDDPAGREYGCFTRMGDGIDIFPTNTLDIQLQTNQCDDRFDNLHQFILKPGARLGYINKLSKNTLVLLSDYEPEQDIEYRTVNLMVIGLKSNNVRSYMISLDNNIEVSYEDMNLDSPFNFMVGNCHIYRNALKGDSFYTLSLDVEQADKYEKSFDGKAALKMDSTKLKILVIFNTSNGHYIEMQQGEQTEDGACHFECRIETNDMITEPRAGNKKENCKISITNLLTRTGAEMESRTIDIMNPDIEFVVFYDYGEDWKFSGHDYTDIEVVKNMVICNKYAPLNDSLYFAYPLSLMRCHVLFQEEPSSTDGYRFLIKQVPVVGKYFVDIDGNASKIFNAIITQHRLLSDVIPLITESFTIIMKYYNTYGRSKLFTILDSGDKEEVLNYVNCKIRLKIKFNAGVLVENYIPEIQRYTKNYLETINETIDDGQNKFQVSRLMEKLHNKFEQIEFILFENINDYESSYQSVYTKEKINESTSPTVIPEYLTIYDNDVIITSI